MLWRAARASRGKGTELFYVWCVSCLCHVSPCRFPLIESEQVVYIRANSELRSSEIFHSRFSDMRYRSNHSDCAPRPHFPLQHHLLLLLPAYMRCNEALQGLLRAHIDVLSILSTLTTMRTRSDAFSSLDDGRWDAGHARLWSSVVTSQKPYAFLSSSRLTAVCSSSYELAVNLRFRVIWGLARASYYAWSFWMASFGYLDVAEGYVRTIEVAILFGSTDAGHLGPSVHRPPSCMRLSAQTTVI